MKALWCFAVLTTVAACTATSLPPNYPFDADLCDVQVGQSFVGMKANAELGAEMLATTGAHELRWVPPRTAVTMDFSRNRLTVSYDDNGIITMVSCT